MNPSIIYTDVNPRNGIRTRYPHRKEWVVGRANHYREAIALAQASCAHGTWWIVSQRVPTREEQLNLPDVKSTKHKPNRIQNILNSI